MHQHGERGLYSGFLMTSVSILVTTVWIGFISDLFYQLFWLHCVYKARGKVQFFLDDRVMKLAFVGGFILYTVDCVLFLNFCFSPSIVSRAFVIEFICFCIAAIVFTGVHVGMILYISLKLFAAFKNWEGADRTKAKRITTLMVLSLGSQGGMFLCLIPTFVLILPATKPFSVSQEFLVWFFFWGGFIGQASAIATSFLHTLTFSSFKRSKKNIIDLQKEASGEILASTTLSPLEM